MPFKGIVVDDEALVRNGIIAKINNYCMDVIITGEAKNGFDALNLIHKMEIDFVITDIKMPIMDGIELIKQVREQNPLIEFIIISGYAEFEFAKKAIFLGVSDYILKPIENEVLREALDRIIKNIDNKSKQNKVMETYVLSSQNQFLNFEHALNYILFRSGTDNMNIREFKELEEFKQKFFTMAVVHIETSKID
ncbi:MAG: response regulator, partial [Ruminiclostridium sp.]|nr:response regulator [Ruminiclostridium sp.]